MDILVSIEILEPFGMPLKDTVDMHSSKFISSPLIAQFKHFNVVLHCTDDSTSGSMPSTNPTEMMYRFSSI